HTRDPLLAVVRPRYVERRGVPVPAGEGLTRLAPEGHELAVVDPHVPDAAARIVQFGVLLGPVDRRQDPGSVVGGELVDRVDDLLAAEVRAGTAQPRDEPV